MGPSSCSPNIAPRKRSCQAALVSEPQTHSLAIQPFGEASRCKTRTAFGAILMAAADLVQFRRLLVDIDLEFGSAAS